MASRPILRLLRSQAPQIRSFTRTSPFLAARPSSRAPPPVPKFVPTRPNPVPAKTNAPAPPVPTKTNAPPPPPPPYAARPPPLPSATKSSTSSTPQSYASGLLGDSESLLLYKGPNNFGLFASCVIVGGCLFVWVGTLAHDAFMHTSTIAMVGVLIPCFFVSAISAAIAITPHHLVKSISIVRTAEKEVVLRVKGTTYFPFRRPALYDLTPGELMIDSNVTMTLDASGRQWWGVPLKNGKAWTEGRIQRPDIEGNAFQRLNRALLNIWPSTRSQVKKMFNREGMAYVRIGSGNWKMDLEGCEILEEGSVLMKLVREGAVRTSLEGIVLRATSRG
jgi:hypothetical protein